MFAAAVIGMPVGNVVIPLIRLYLKQTLDNFSSSRVHIVVSPLWSSRKLHSFYTLSSVRSGIYENYILSLILQFRISNIKLELCHRVHAYSIQLQTFCFEVDSLSLPLSAQVPSINSMKHLDKMRLSMPLLLSSRAHILKARIPRWIVASI